MNLYRRTGNEFNCKSNSSLMDRSSQGSSLCVRVMRVQAKEDHIIAVRKVLESMKINEDDLDDDDDFMGDSPEVAFCACVLHGHAN